MQQPKTVLHYWQRAASFYRTAQDLEILDVMTHAPAIGLLSVHGSLALADALLVAAEGERPRGDDHSHAARQLRAWCSAKKIAEGGIKHFEWLLGRKSHFSYDNRPVDVEDFKAAKVKMDQFFKWAKDSFPDVADIREIDHA